MNFVAHQYLSFHQPEIQIGNLYGEIVRGKDYLDYSGDLQKGILLHRQIDTFTDSHEAVKNSTRKFHKRFGKYAPVIVDVLYDYLLIMNWETYSKQSYKDFVHECYDLFRLHYEEFPPQLQYIVKHLLQHDWFHNYSTLEGIGKTLQGLSQRSKFLNNMGEAVNEFQEHQQDLENDFSIFFPELVTYCKAFLKS